MSKTIDERVVEMRFDNKDFESNVKQSMSTLDKLKQALKFPSSSSKSSMSAVANSVKTASSNMNGLNNAVSTVRASFSALDVVAVTALGNITNGVVNATKNLVKSFTIDPITSGLREYELQMNSIQTILANTKSKGTTIDDVTKALDELNEYADLTIYNFAEMTKNIGTFTAAGVDLDTSVGAIKGIANLGAMSSSTSAQVNTAMYQLSQALATGRVSLMDWNSVVNAGMGGEQFQNALKRTAKNMGTDVDALIKKYGSFRESLTMGGWLTADVLNETLNQIGGAYDEAALRAKGYSEENIKAILDLAETATNAATEVKTFTQLMDTLHEAAGSGWAKTWQLIFGDFYESKDFFSGLHKMLEPVVTGPIDAMNSVIEEAMGGGGESRWGEFETQLKNAGTSAKEFQTELAKVYKASGKGSLDDLVKDYGSLEKAMASGKITSEEVSKALSQLSTEAEKSSKTINDSGKSLAEWQSIVDDVWRGDYGNSDTGHFEKLAKAGWDYKKVQELVNMTVDGHKLTLEDLTEAQIVSMGYTKEQAKALKELADEASAAGKPMNELINDILTPKKSGRELFLEGLKNVLTAIINPLQAVGRAFSSVFSVDAKGLYNLIEGFNEFSKAINLNETDLKNLESAFRGIFSVIHIISSAFGNTLVFAIKTANILLAPFGTNVLAIAGQVGEVIYQFDRWVTSGDGIRQMLSVLGDLLSWVTTPLRKFFDGFSNIKIVQQATTVIAEFFGGIKDYFAEFEGLDIGEAFSKLVDDISNFFKNLTWEDVLEGLTEFGEKFLEFFSKIGEELKTVGPDIITGLLNGISEGAGMAWTKMQEIGNAIINAICSVLGIHSPSTVMYEIGRNIVQGLINGIQSLIGGVTDAFASIGVDIQEVFSNIDWGAVAAIGTGVGAFVVLYQFTDALQTFATGVKQATAPMQSAGNLITSIKTTVDGFNQMAGFESNTSSKGLLNLANSIRIFAQSIAIIAGAVAVLAVLDTGKMIAASVAIGILMGVLGGVVIAVSKFAAQGSMIDTMQISTLLLSLAGTFAIVAVAVRVLNGVDSDAFGKAITLFVTLAAVVSALTLVNRLGGDKEINNVTNILTKLGVAFALMAVATKLMGGLSVDEIGNAIVVIGMFTTVVSLLMIFNRIGGQADAAAQVISKIGVAFLLLAVVSKILGNLTGEEMGKAIVMLGYFTICVGLLTAISRIAKGVEGVSTYIAQVGLCFVLLAATARILGGMTGEEMGKALAMITAFTAVIIALTAAMNLIPKGQIKSISTALLSMSLAIGIIAGIAVLLGYVKTENLVKGIAAVSALSVLVSLMAQSARGVRDVGSTMTGMAIAIGVMAAAIAVLSFIDVDRLATATAALAVVMGMFALMTKSATGFGEGFKVGPIISMIGVLTVLSAALYILAGLPIESTMGSAVALSTLLVALSASMKLLNNNSMTVNSDMVKSVVLMTVALAALGGVLHIVAGLDPVGSMGNAVALSALLLALTASIRLLDNVKGLDIVSVISVLAPMMVVVAVLAEILTAISGLDPLGSVANVAALSTLLITLTACTAILSRVGALGSAAAAAVPGFLAISAAVIAVIGVVVGIATAIGQIEGAAEAIEKGGEVLGAIGSAIGNFIGSFVGGIGEGITASLVTMADNLSAFIDHLQPFLDGVSTIDPSSMEGLQALASALLTLTGASFLNSIASLIGMGADFEGLSNAMKPLGEALSSFADATSGIDGVTDLAMKAMALKSVVEAFASIPNSGGWLEDLIGGKDYTGFAQGMTSIGNALASFNTVTEGMDDIGSLNTRIEGLKNLISAMNQVPSEGGFLGMLIGGKDFSKFADGMSDMGDALKEFYDSTTNIEDPSRLQSIIQALNSLISGMQGIPNEGGWIDNLLGNKKFDNFAEGMKAIGTALYNFYDSTSGIEDTGKLNGVISATTALIEGMQGIPSEGGFLDNLFGSQDVNKFASGIASIGNAIYSFAYMTSGISDIDTFKGIVDATCDLIEGMSDIPGSGGMLDTLFGGKQDFSSFSLAMSNIAAAMQSFSAVSNLITDPNAFATTVSSTKYLLQGLSGIEVSGGLLEEMLGGTSFASLGVSLSSLGYAMQTYVNNVSGLDFTNVTPSVTAMKELLDFLNSLEEIDSSGVESFKQAIEDLSSIDLSGLASAFDSEAVSAMADAGKNIVSAISEAITTNASGISDALTSAMATAVSSATPETAKFSTVGEMIVKAIAQGVGDNDDAVAEAAKTAVSDAKSSAEAVADDFYSVGAQMSAGLAAGMRAHLDQVEKAADAMANAAAKAVAAAAQVRSPSRVMKRIGAFMGEGLLIGLESYTNPVYKASYTMGSKSIEGMRSAVASIGDVIDSDMDFSPTISPVLDLNNVRSGAATLNSLFANPGLEMSGFLNTTGRLIDARIQNGSFDDVVKAVDRVRGKLGELERPSYTVNGVTYDDGSNIAQFAEGLVRTLRVEERRK